MKLLSFIVKRLIIAVATLYVLASITFVFMRAVPGDPLTKSKEVPLEVRKNLEAKYGLDKPLIEQYFIQMKKIFIDFEFGDSFRTVGRNVNDMIKEQFPASGVLGLFAITVGVSFGFVFGILAAFYRNTSIDRSIMVFCVVGIAIPSALMAYVLQYFFAFYPLTSLGVNPEYWFRTVGWSEPRDILLPGLTLSLPIFALMTRYMRSQMIDVGFSEYIKTAKAKGVSTLRLILFHQVRNAILPIISILGPVFIAAVSGSLVVEGVFGVPGLGTAFINSINNNDYNVLMGLTVFYGGFFVCVNLLTDILYGVVDPRIRVG